MPISTAPQPEPPDVAARRLGSNRGGLGRVRGRLRRMLFPRPDAAEAAGRTDDAEAVEQESTQLKRQLAQYKKEQALFDGLAPFALGTERAAEIIPPIPGAGVRSSVGSPSMAGFLVSSDAWQILLSRFLRPDSRVLDVGCGCGKMARGLAYHPYVQKFIGFDVIPSNIDFCNAELAPRLGPAFEFHRVDVYSKCYNPGGTVKGADLVFPAADGSIDLAFACSLFTHLLEPAARRYLREVRRVLSSDGLFLPSIHVAPAPGTRYSGDEVRVDVEPEYFVEIAAEAGLHVVSRLGNVCGQYTIVFTPAPPA